jgi:ankyrin repeat protein
MDKLIKYIQQHNTRKLRELLDSKAIRDKLDTKINSYTPLTHAIILNNKNAVKILLQAGANPNLISYGHTPLMNASWWSRIECVRLLLQAGAKINIQGIDGITALMLASRFNIDCVRLLLQAGANPLLKYKNNLTAYDFATDETIKQLLNKAMNAYSALSLLGPTFKKKSGLPADIGREAITKYLFSKKNKKSKSKSKSKTKTKSKKSKKRLI